MNIEEFSNEFDILIQSHMPDVNYGEQNAIMFDEYEKSVFLSRAQLDIILDIYKGVGDFYSFESSEESRRLLSNLIETVELIPLKEEVEKISNNSQAFVLPEDLMFITYEVALLSKRRCCHNVRIPVVPVTQDEFNRVIENPFRRNSDIRVLRLDSKDNIVELVSNYDIEKYKIRYLKIPTPIILIDLPDNLSINNISTKTECILSKSLHKKILDRAVVLALNSKNINK